MRPVFVLLALVFLSSPAALADDAPPTPHAFVFVGTCNAKGWQETHFASLPSCSGQRGLEAQGSYVASDDATARNYPASTSASVGVVSAGQSVTFFQIRIPYDDGTSSTKSYWGELLLPSKGP